MANPIIHWELMVKDVEKAKAFYGRLFDWTIDDQKFPGYTTIQPGSGPMGGMMARPPGVPMSALNTYFKVADLDATLKRAVELGAKIIVPKREVPGICCFAIFLDPEQIPVGILQEK